MPKNRIAAFIVAGVSAVVVWGVQLLYVASTLDTESKRYADTAIPAIIRSWNVDELMSRATPKMKSETDVTKLRVLFDSLKRLGKLLSYGPARGEAAVPFIMGSSEAFTGVFANYSAKAMFDNGNAVITITITRHDDKWMIKYFHVDFKILREGANT